MTNGPSEWGGPAALALRSSEFKWTKGSQRRAATMWCGDTAEGDRFIFNLFICAGSIPRGKNSMAADK